MRYYVHDFTPSVKLNPGRISPERTFSLSISIYYLYGVAVQNLTLKYGSEEKE